MSSALSLPAHALRFLALAVLIAAVPAVESAGTPLFNGKDLTGWDGDPRLWSVRDGVLVGETTDALKAKGNTFIIWKGGTLGDFDLTFTARLTGGNNSGVQYRSKDHGNWVVKGYQFDVNSGPDNLGKLYDEGGRGRIGMPGEKVLMGADGGKKQVVGKVAEPAQLAAAEKKGDWNTYRIIARGAAIQHFVNGTLVLDLTDEDTTKGSRSGILALQLHAGGPMKIEYKDIVLKDLAKR